MPLLLLYNPNHRITPLNTLIISIFIATHLSLIETRVSSKVNPLRIFIHPSHLCSSTTNLHSCTFNLFFLFSQVDNKLII